MMIGGGQNKIVKTNSALDVYIGNSDSQKTEFKHCISKKNVRMFEANQYSISVSAATGDLFDYHEVLSINFYDTSFQMAMPQKTSSTKKSSKTETTLEEIKSKFANNMKKGNPTEESPDSLLSEIRQIQPQTTLQNFLQVQNRLKLLDSMVQYTQNAVDKLQNKMDASIQKRQQLADIES